MKFIKVLGQKYSIEFKTEEEDKELITCEGYCDSSNHRIVICKKHRDEECGDFEATQKVTIRHEIVHAFLFESGIFGQWKHLDGHDESYVQWIAYQMPKIAEACREAGAL